ncbi:hypothetical protein FRC17_010702 [Serendipita sp. 399]|nr:hypothetical protein FRC17_010702 [Serendipita sp. 399]
MDPHHSREPSASSSARFPEAPAPWVLRGEGYWFITSLFGQSTPSITPVYYDPLEAQAAKHGSAPGAFKGGLSMAVVMRYKESPVGAYDELLIVPGAFTTPKFDKDTQNLTVARTYVSTLPSVYNGRRNWNVAKHLAKFEFKKGPNGAQEIRVYPLIPSSPGDDTTFSDKPCFAASATPSWLPILPYYDTGLSPFNLNLVQPPIEASPYAEIDGLVGSPHWTKLLPVYHGKVKTFTPRGLLDGNEYSDNVYFPKISPWSTGIYWPDCTLDFPVPRTLTEEEAPNLDKPL